MSSPTSDKTVSLPDLTYSQRETILTALIERKVYFEKNLKETNGTPMGDYYMSSLEETIEVYDLIQNHF